MHFKKRASIFYFAELLPFRNFFLFIMIIFYSPLLLANNPTVLQTKNKLAQLNNQIYSLKQALVRAHDKEGLLNRELITTEKQIGASVQKLDALKQALEEKQRRIIFLQQNMETLNRELLTQQQRLAKYVRLRYQIGEYQPLKWLLNQNDFSKANQLLTNYRYLLTSRQKIVHEITSAKQHLLANQMSLKKEIDTTRALQNQWALNQEKLQNTKAYQAAIMQSLHNEIKNKKLTLEDYEKNKKSLTQLLQSLLNQSIVSTKSLFATMHHKLPLPLQKRTSLQRINQGVTFFADEGTPVYAVYSGKVVFSDWLNGYGFLLIIDHGQGYMSLYAHNQSLFKQKGTFITTGEQIAAVGHSGSAKQNGLYFEIRQRGKAVSPFDWLYFARS